MNTCADSPCGVQVPFLGRPDRAMTRTSSACNLLVVVLMMIAVAGVLGAAPTQAGEPEAKEIERIIKVGPQRQVKTLAEASRIAQAGDTLEVDAGDYLRDVTVWMQAKLKIKAVGGRVRLVADGV